MHSPHLPAAPWTVCKHATPDHAPQFGIYSDNDDPYPLDFVIVKGSRELADAIAALPDVLRTLNSFRTWLACPALDKATIAEMERRAIDALLKAGYTF